jgi:hypothetical protein
MNVPVVHMMGDIMVLMRVNPFGGPLVILRTRVLLYDMYIYPTPIPAHVYPVKPLVQQCVRVLCVNK